MPFVTLPDPQGFICQSGLELAPKFLGGLPMRGTLSPNELIQATVEMESEGLCVRAGVDPDRWFPDEALHPRANRARGASLRRASRQCLDEDGEPYPVRVICLRVALTRGESNGIWAGFPGWRLREIYVAETKGEQLTGEA
jgi:hypothetical protein